MKQMVILTILTLTVVFGTGCTSGYWTDRGRDAADIFTISYGYGLGAKAIVGPLHAGLLFNSEIGGMRGGVIKPVFEPNSAGHGATPVDFKPAVDLDITLMSLEWFEEEDASERRKTFKSDSALIYPVWQLKDRRGIPTCTKLEVVAGCGLSLRLGFNPGELVDFLFGIFGTDLFDDDLEKQYAQ